MTRQLTRQVRLSNMLMLILLGFGVLLLIPSIIENGINSSVYLDLFSIGIIIFLLWLNKKGYINVTRIIISVYPPLIVLSASIIVKILQPKNVAVFDFFDARILLLGLFVIPFLLFSYKEKAYLFIATSFPFLLVIFFDPIHTLFGVGYENFFGSAPKSYIVSGIYIDIALVFLIGSVYSFKANIEYLLVRNILLSTDLGEKNIELSKLFENLEMSNINLRKNKKVIENQKDQLKRSNIGLIEEVEKKAAELKQSNNELINHNNELQQFSNTLSHNLRGPVANLLGLSNLFKIDKSEESRQSIAEHIYKSAETLDIVIKDLNKIVELRNNLFQIKEKIDINEEIANIWIVLETSVKQSGATLDLNIEAPITFGVRSYFHSILYNLISNAIKYRHPKRPCVISITSRKDKVNCIITVKDNGIGVDLDKYGDKIFGMYKRFHTHLEGKGLGLFLTKQQIETMGGNISVESDLNIGTEFVIKFPTVNLSEIESQLFYRGDVANIYLDVKNLITTLVWKKMPTPTEFKEVFSNNIEVFSAYSSDKWIVDLSLVDVLLEEEKQWILAEAVDQYLRVGIRKIVIIRSSDNLDVDFLAKFKSVTNDKAMEVTFATSRKEAKEKLLNV